MTARRSGFHDLIFDLQSAWLVPLGSFFTMMKASADNEEDPTQNTTAAAGRYIGSWSPRRNLRRLR